MVKGVHSDGRGVEFGACLIIVAEQVPQPP